MRFLHLGFDAWRDHNKEAFYIYLLRGADLATTLGSSPFAEVATTARLFCVLAKHACALQIGKQAKPSACFPRYQLNVRDLAKRPPTFTCCGGPICTTISRLWALRITITLPRCMKTHLIRIFVFRNHLLLSWPAFYAIFLSLLVVSSWLLVSTCRRSSVG